MGENQMRLDQSGDLEYIARRQFGERNEGLFTGGSNSSSYVEHKDGEELSFHNFIIQQQQQQAHGSELEQHCEEAGEEQRQMSQIGNQSQAGGISSASHAFSKAGGLSLSSNLLLCEQSGGTLIGGNSKLVAGGGRGKVLPTGNGSRPKCVECGKDFSNQSALSKHRLTHSDERRFICSICSKAFKRQDHLNGHLLTHRDKKPFQCDFDGCEKTYCDARSLKRHKENHHNQQQPSGLLLLDPGGALRTHQFSSVQQQPSSNPLFSNQVLNRIQYAPPAHNNEQQHDEYNSNSSNQQGGEQAHYPSPFLDSSQHEISQQNLLHQLLTQQLATTTTGGGGAPFQGHVVNEEEGEEGSLVGDSVGGVVPSLLETQSMGDQVGGVLSLVGGCLDHLGTALQESSLVSCSICYKKFKTVPALNGHMRLHGGYQGLLLPHPPPPSSQQKLVPGGYAHSSSSSSQPQQLVVQDVLKERLLFKQQQQQLPVAPSLIAFQEATRKSQQDSREEEEEEGVCIKGASVGGSQVGTGGVRGGGGEVYSYVYPVQVREDNKVKHTHFDASQLGAELVGHNLDTTGGGGEPPVSFSFSPLHLQQFHQESESFAGGQQADSESTKSVPNTPLNLVEETTPPGYNNNNQQHFYQHTELLLNQKREEEEEASRRQEESSFLVISEETSKDEHEKRHYSSSSLASCQEPPLVVVEERLEDEEEEEEEEEEEDTMDDEEEEEEEEEEESVFVKPLDKVLLKVGGASQSKEESSRSRKEKKKPDPLFIPPHLNNFNANNTNNHQGGVYSRPVGVSPRVSIFQTSNSSSAIYHSSSSSAAAAGARGSEEVSPPPYTPPPMLSPVRTNSGFYWHIIHSSSLGSTSASTPPSNVNPLSPPLAPPPFPQAPPPSSSGPMGVEGGGEEAVRQRIVSSGLLTPYEKDDNNYDSFALFNCSFNSSSDGNVTPHVNIGVNYQARIPLFQPQLKAHQSEKEDQLLWSPHDLMGSREKEQELDSLLEILCSSLVPGGGRNKELGYHLFHLFHSNFDDCLSFILSPPTNNNKRERLLRQVEETIADYKYSETTLWSKREILKYQEALHLFDKDFRQISCMLESKTTKECVEFYYLWKKVCGDEYRRLRVIRRKKEEESLNFNLRSKQQQALASFQDSYNDSEMQHFNNEDDGDDEHEEEEDNEDDDQLIEDDLVNEEDEEEQEKRREVESSQRKKQKTEKARKEAPSVAGEAVYACRICGKCFSKVKSRSAHMKIHGSSAKHSNS